MVINVDKELIITFSYYGIGGAQRRAVSLANKFSECGFNVYVLAVLGNDLTIKKDNFYNLNKNVTLINIPEYYQKHKQDKSVVISDEKISRKLNFLKKAQVLLKPFSYITNIINYKIKYYRQCKETRAFLINHKKSTIINFGFNIFDIVNFASRGMGCKIIYAETNASNKYSWDRFLKFTSKSIKKSDATVFQTIVEKEEHGLTKSKKAYIIHNPIKPGLPLPYEGIRKKTIVNFCRLSRQKNLLLLIKAFEQLHKDFPDYTLELYVDSADPNNAEYKKELMFYITSNGLEGCIHILPPSSKIHNIILDSAMFVSSSDYEGISNSMIEAMAIGLPCVCTDCGGGGAREMITDGENGLLVPVGDAEALKNAMVRMITEDGLSEKCSKNAAKIRETHSIEKISEKWLDIIRNV